MDEAGVYHEEKVISEVGDYSRIYEGIYESIVNGAPKIVKDEETLKQMEILEEGIHSANALIAGYFTESWKKGTSLRGGVLFVV